MHVFIAKARRGHTAAVLEEEIVISSSTPSYVPAKEVTAMEYAVRTLII